MSNRRNGPRRIPLRVSIGERYIRARYRGKPADNNATEREPPEVRPLTLSFSSLFFSFPSHCFSLSSSISRSLALSLSSSLARSLYHLLVLSLFQSLTFSFSCSLSLSFSLFRLFSLLLSNTNQETAAIQFLSVARYRITSAGLAPSRGDEPRNQSRSFEKMTTRDSPWESDSPAITD